MTPMTNKKKNEAILDIVKVAKIFPPDFLALEDVSFTINRGELVFLTGVSGAGKTTLLNMLCFVEQQTRGLIEIDQQDVSKLSQVTRQQLRQNIGVAYQEFRLLSKHTAFQNIAMAMEVKYENQQKIKNRVSELLTDLGLAGKTNTLAGKLSRGEQQRVSIARACANKPDIILADEPTANLDQSSKDLVMNLFKKLHKEGATIIIATHDTSIYGDMEHRVVNIELGKLQEIIPVNLNI